MACDLREVVSHFDFCALPVPYGDGHINDTYDWQLVAPRFILQRINKNVFKKPEEVMENIVGVTTHLRKKLSDAGRDPDRETLTVIPTTDGKAFYLSPEGDYYRMYRFIEGTRTDQRVEKPEQFRSAGYAFGDFQNLLADYDAKKLHDVIPSFHDTRKRFAALKEAIAADPLGRAAECKEEIDFALAREHEVGMIMDRLEDGRLPWRVTHNDTKYNNILLDAETEKALCVIDLDTVMPGSLLFDYGDSLRFGSNPAAEDEKDLSLVYCDLVLFEAFTLGFMEAMGNTLTEEEIRLMPLSARMMTYECGIRFLTDYLMGDTYFKIHRPEHNLDRTRTQLKLVADMEEKEEEIIRIIDRCKAAIGR